MATAAKKGFSRVYLVRLVRTIDRGLFRHPDYFRLAGDVAGIHQGLKGDQAYARVDLEHDTVRVVFRDGRAFSVRAGVARTLVRAVRDESGRPVGDPYGEGEYLFAELQARLMGRCPLTTDGRPDPSYRSGRTSGPVPAHARVAARARTCDADTAEVQECRGAWGGVPVETA